jgi:dipeptidyl aminopeptidase/acylaminoacyl peptidase
MRIPTPALSVLSSAALAAALFCSPRAARADDLARPAKPEPWKPEDVIYAEAAQPQTRISPDGRYLVWIKSTGDKEKDARVSNLFLSSLTGGGKEVQLTRGSDNNGQPQWSPDGQLLVFSSNRARQGAKPEAAPVQIWLISPFGGEPWPLTELARPPQHLDWLDKETVLFSAQEDPSLYAQELKQKKDDSEVVDDAEHEPPVRLYKININDKKIVRLTRNTDRIGNWSVSKDGKYVAAVHAKSLHYTFDQKIPPVTLLHNLADGTEKQIFTEGRVRPLGFEWAPDGSGFYAWAPYSTDPRFLTATIIELYFFDLAAGKSVKVPLEWENGIGSDLAAVDDGFVAGLAAGHRYETSRYMRSKSGDGWSWKRASLEGEHAKNIQYFEVDGRGRKIVYFYSTASRLPQIYRAQLEGARIAQPEQLTRLNEGLTRNRAFARTEVVRWKGSNDEEVEGILYYPTRYEAGRKYPLITAIHGGPTGHDSDAWEDNWAYPINLLTERGAFVLRPNYHGSGNYGLKWVESICCGKYYDLETPDINAGVDYLIAKGLADADRIATLGWSNGSILSTSLITTYPSRYKAASVGAGDVEWISDWGNVTFGDSFDSYYFGKSPMEDPDLYIRKSPFFKMDKVQAPVLIFHGTADTNVPPAQSWSFFRALQYHGKVPVKFVVFPGEPHGPRKLTHQLRKVEEEVAWFDKYFFKTEKPASGAVKKDSPLYDAGRRQGVERVLGNYGTAFPNPAKKASGPPRGTALIPEVVRRGELQIGRFEVTRAQLRGCGNPDRGVPAGTAKDAQAEDSNYPANGVSLEQAKAYADCLSKLTGQTWRIPYEDEVKELYASRGGENTLDYWAGYAPNPEDAASLREEAARLKGGAALLKEVGSFRGQGKDDEEPLYDLGGNVAEWVLTRAGSGKALGGSADCPADGKAACAAAPEYVGFRVVFGAAKPPANP